MRKHTLFKSICVGLLLLLLEISTVVTCHAQALIRGRVVDSRTKEPIMAASVVLDKTTIGTSTDVNGTFSLNIPDSLIKKRLKLIISMVGYTRQDILIKEKDLPLKRDFTLTQWKGKK